MKNESLKNRIKRGTYDLFYIWKKEIRSIFRNQAVLTFFIMLPLFYPITYAYIYTNEVIRHIPAVVIDKSNSKLSREFIRKVNSTPDVKIVAHCTDIEEAKELVRLQEAYGIIVIPSDFSKQLNQGKTTQISVLCDMSGILYYKGLVSSTTAVSLDMNKDIKIALSGNTTKREDELSAYPIQYEEVALYNPANGMASYLIPAVLILIIQQSILLGMSVISGSNREENRFHSLIPTNKHYMGTLRIVLGKGLSYYMICIMLAFYVVIIVPWLFSLPHIGNPGNVILFIIPYLAACTFFSMTVSAIVKDKESGLLIFVFTSIVLLFGSGISWPLSNVPTFWKYFFHLFPSTFGIKGYVALNSMGADLYEVSYEYKALWIQTGVYFIFTFFIYRYQIIAYRKRVIKKYKEMKAKTSLRK